MSISTTKTWQRGGSTFRRSPVITRLNQQEFEVLQEPKKAKVPILNLLQDEEHRSLSVVELSRRAGYAGTRQWFKALEDEGFRAEIEGLGVSTAASRRDLH